MLIAIEVSHKLVIDFKFLIYCLALTMCAILICKPIFVTLASRRVVMGHKVKKKQHMSMSSGLHDHYNELIR